MVYFHLFFSHNNFIHYDYGLWENCILNWIQVLVSLYISLHGHFGHGACVLQQKELTILAAQLFLIFLASYGIHRPHRTKNSSKLQYFILNNLQQNSLNVF